LLLVRVSLKFYIDMRELRSLLPYMRRYRSTYLFGLLFVVISNILTTLGPRFLERAIDELTRSAPLRAVAWSIALMVFVAVVGGAARYGMRECLNSGSRRVETDMRDDLFGHLLRQDAGFYDRHPTGDIMARATNDLTALRMVAGPALMYLVDTTMRAMLVIPAMAHISARLTLLALLPMVALPLVMIFLGRMIHNRSLAIQTFFGVITSHVHEHISGVRVVRAYRQERAETRTFVNLNDEYLSRNLSLAYAQGAFHPLLALFGGLGTVVVLLLGGQLVINGTVTAGAFVAFGVYLAMLVWPLIALGWAVNLVQRATAAMQRIGEIMRERPVITSPQHPAVLPPSAGARSVTFENVWFRYPAAHDRGFALSDVSFHVAAGRSLAIVGATGAGKSTVAELVSRAYDPARGRVLIDGVAIDRLALPELRGAIGIVPQETFLFSDTLRNNVLLGAPDDGRLERVAEVSQLAAAIPELPRGYDTMLGERGINLSGGQKQRAAIARALAQDPPIFVLDDALSAVDAHTEAKILQALRGALEGRTTIIISHRLAAVRDADEIIVLEEGRVVERGTHPVLIAARGRYWELLKRQEVEEELELTA
jgi:ATP-binding cassette subfamily B multidrug efflux pump